MLNLLPTTRVFVCTRPTDLRKGFNGLSALTMELVKQNPLSGHLFVFRNKGGDKLKVLYWGGDGYCLWYKRLERGTFELPKSGEVGVEISGTELNMLIDGVALNSVRRKRFSLARAA
jgi:transposase